MVLPGFETERGKESTARGRGSERNEERERDHDYYSSLTNLWVAACKLATTTPRLFLWIP